MENKKINKTPNKYLARMQAVHFGKILFNLQFLALAVMLASVLTFIFPAIYYLVLISIMLFTFFTAFINPAFASWWAGGEKLTEIATIFAGTWKYTVPIVLALSVASIICLCLDKNQKHVARIVVSCIIAVGALIALVLKLINGGGA